MSSLVRLTSDHGSRKLPWFTLVTTGSVILLYALLGAAPDALMWDRDFIMDGQIWRLISGHLVHADFEHLVWNVSAFVVLGAVLQCGLGHGTQKMALTFASSAAVIHGIIYFVRPDLIWYVGLSGVLNSYFIVALYGIWQKTRSTIALFAGIGAVAKTLAETLLGGSVLGIGSWQAVPEAHMAGLIAGILFVVSNIFINPDIRPTKDITTF